MLFLADRKDRFINGFYLYFVVTKETKSFVSAPTNWVETAFIERCFGEKNCDYDGLATQVEFDQGPRRTGRREWGQVSHLSFASHSSLLTAVCVAPKFAFLCFTKFYIPP